MTRRELLAGGAAMAATAALRSTADEPAARLIPPDKGSIPVAFVISNDATMIDFTGPWEVFQDCQVEGRGADDDDAFRLFTVAEAATVVRVTGGMQVTPDFSVENAPQPRVIVVPAHRSTPGLRAWILKASQKTDLTMSVCTGAFALAQAGLANRPRSCGPVFDAQSRYFGAWRGRF